MGSRGDYAHREKKKTRKDSQKIAPVTITTSAPVEVEVIRKKKKPREEAEE
jgi:hypothetical protein